MYIIHALKLRQEKVEFEDIAFLRIKQKKHK